MWPHLFHLLGKALTDMPSIVSSNWAAVVLSIGIFSVSQFCLWLRGGWQAMKRQWAGSLTIGVVSVIAGWVLLFCWSVVRTVYGDHESLVQRVDGLRREQSGLVLQLIG